MASLSMSRRRFVASSVAAAGALQLAQRAFSQSGTACLLTPGQEMGPFYLADEMVRSRIAEGKPGIPLQLRLVVFDQKTCLPLPGAAVDLWHCDAMGLYSGFTTLKDQGPPFGFDPSHGPPPGFDPRHGPPPGFDPSHGPPPGFDPDKMPALPSVPKTDRLTFLRGIQITDKEGTVSFQTIFPGFYSGRTNHVHFKVRLEGHSKNGRYHAGHTAYTGQIFFPEDMNVKLMAEPPYAEHHIHRTTQGEDYVYNDEHGATAMATLLPADGKKTRAGLIAEFHAAVDPHATPEAVGMRFGQRL